MMADMQLVLSIFEDEDAADSAAVSDPRIHS